MFLFLCVPPDWLGGMVPDAPASRAVFARRNTVNVALVNRAGPGPRPGLSRGYGGLLQSCGSGLLPAAFPAITEQIRETRDGTGTMNDKPGKPHDAKAIPSGDLTVRTIAMPADTNANGDIFGGWVMAHMD